MSKTYHPISAVDATTMAATREFLKTLPNLDLTPEVRPIYDEMILQVPQVPDIDYQSDELGAVLGWRCILPGTPSDAVILYLHGGGYVVGSAKAYCNVVGQIAEAAGVNAFVPEYGLAPERAFPASFDDAVAVYDALVHQGFKRIAIVGDSAGGGLTLAVASHVCQHRQVKPVAAVAISPWTDMTASGSSIHSRASIDPLLSRQKLLQAADLYLDGANPKDHRASPLFGPMDSLPPVLIHVGEDEVLLDDATRYAERAEAAGSKVELHIWAGMLHVFTSSITTLEAANLATKDIGEFLKQNLNVAL